MASVKEQLVNSLKDLVKDDLKKFQWHLKNHGCVSTSEMENADVLDTVDKMVAIFGLDEAVKITVNILRKITQNDLPEVLENKHKQVNQRMELIWTSEMEKADVSDTVDTVVGCRLGPEEAEKITVNILRKSNQNNLAEEDCMFSEPNPSGLVIHCQSCVHIADSDQWLPIDPTDEGGSKFSVRTDPGRYECVRTRMRWVCACAVSLQYRTVDGLSLNAELERLQCSRIGPVMDVTVISGKLEEVHLPHYACLGESDPSLKDAVKVLTVRDEGITTEPVQLTRFHAKIVQPSFSIKTLIINWFMGWYEHCDLLLYMRSQDPLILHLYFFPIDECAKEKVEKKEKRNYPIEHPRPGRPFRMRTQHVLSAPGASIHPREGITLAREIPPNFFKVKTRLENDLQMTLIREEDQESVWTAMIEKDELDQIRPERDEPRLNSEADKARYFDTHWPDLIQNVTNVQIIADKLCQQKILHKEQYSKITHGSLTNQDRMRKICEIIDKHSDAVKAEFISVLQEEKLYHF